MQKCRNCTSEFKWKEVFKSAMFSYKPIVCKNCGLQYNVKSRFRIINALIITAPLLLNLLLQLHSRSNYFFYGFIIYEVLIGLLMPFWTKYRVD